MPPADFLSLVASATLDPSTPFYQRFLVSPGFAGVFAVVAALIAARVAWKGVQATNSQAQLQRNQDLTSARILREKEVGAREADQRFKALEWLLANRDTLEAGEVVDMLTALHKLSSTIPERALVSAASTLFTVEDPEEKNNGAK